MFYLHVTIEINVTGDTYIPKMMDGLEEVFVFLYGHFWYLC